MAELETVPRLSDFLAKVTSLVTWGTAITTSTCHHTPMPHPNPRLDGLVVFLGRVPLCGPDCLALTYGDETGLKLIEIQPLVSSAFHILGLKSLHHHI